MSPESLQIDDAKRDFPVSIEEIEKSRFALTAIKNRLRLIPVDDEGEDEFNTTMGYKKVSRERENINKMVGVCLMNGWAIHVSTIEDEKMFAHRFNINEYGDEISYYTDMYGVGHASIPRDGIKLEGVEAITAFDQSRELLLSIWASIRTNAEEGREFEFARTGYKMPLVYVPES